MSVSKDLSCPSPTEDLEIIRFPDNLPCDCNGPTLVTMQQTIEEWAHLYNQRAERHWLSYYEEALLAAYNAPGCCESKWSIGLVLQPKHNTKKTKKE